MFDKHIMQTLLVITPVLIAGIGAILIVLTHQTETKENTDG